MQLEPGYHLHKGAKVERTKLFYLKMDVFDCHSSNCRKLEVNQKKYCINKLVLYLVLKTIQQMALIFLNRQFIDFTF